MKWGKRFLRLVTHNAGWKLLSLAIAVAVWAVVANEPELSTFVTAGVEYKNLPEDLEISSNPETTVKLELRGPSGELRGLSDGSTPPEVVLDMSTVQTGDRTFPIGDGNVRITRGVHMVRAIPSEVRFHFERSARKTVHVTPRFRPRAGYEVKSFSMSPDAVEIAGPASRVAAVDSVLTDQVNIPALAGTFKFPVNTFVDDSFIRFPSLTQVTVTVTIRKTTAPELAPEGK